MRAFMKQALNYDISYQWSAQMPVTEYQWEDRVKGILKAELKRRNISYAELVVLLSEHGVTDTEPNIRNKISRGKFTAVFFVQCLKAIGVSELRL